MRYSNALKRARHQMATSPSAGGLNTCDVALPLLLALPLGTRPAVPLPGLPVSAVSVSALPASVAPSYGLGGTR